MSSAEGASIGPQYGPVGRRSDGDDDAARPSVLVADDSRRAAQLREWLDDVLPVVVATSGEDVEQRIDRTVCVALLGRAVPQERKAAILETIDVRNPFARTIVVPEDDQPPMLGEPGYDLCLYSPLEREDVREAVTTLARVATYERTLSTYYEYTTLAANREIGEDEADLASDEAYQALQQRIDALRESLERMQDAMDETERELLFDATERDDDATFDGEVREAPYTGQPEECAECGLDWRVDRGGELGVGYDRLGAFVWKCRRCGAIQQRSDPSHQWIA